MKKKKYKEAQKFESTLKADEVKGFDMIKYIEDSGALLVHDVDESGSYSFTEEEKLFIRLWVEFKNLNIVAESMSISNEDASKMFSNYYVTSEIRRLEKEVTKLRLAQKIMTLDEMEAYLSSLVIDYSIPMGERVSPRDKLAAVKLLMEIKQIKGEAFQGNTTVINALPTADKLDSLSTDAIRALISADDASQTAEEKEKIINELISISNLSTEEKLELRGKSVKELQDLLTKWESTKPKKE